MRVRTIHESDNWLVLIDGSNAFNPVRRTAVLAGVVNFGPALTSLVAKCYGTRFAEVFSGWTPGKPGRSPFPAVSSGGGAWGRLSVPVMLRAV